MERKHATGDWRRRSRESANVIIRDGYAKPWHRQTFWIVFFLVVLWPVGIVLTWKSDWPVVAKVVASALLAFTVYASWSLYQAVMSMPPVG